MKHFITIFLIIYSSVCNGQAYFEMGAGSDSKFITGNINAGYQINNLVIEGAISAAITSNSQANNFFALKAGYNIKNFIPSIGYFFNKKSSDNNTLNGSYLGYSMKYYLPVNDNGGLYTDILYVKTGVQFTAGFRVTF